MTDLLSDQIYLSRDSIREQISQEVENYMELNNVDLTKIKVIAYRSLLQNVLIIITIPSLKILESLKNLIAAIVHTNCY